jgi:hypothetical protein
MITLKKSQILVAGAGGLALRGLGIGMERSRCAL